MKYYYLGYTNYVFDLNNLFIEARVNITIIKPPHIYGKNL